MLIKCKRIFIVGTSSICDEIVDTNPDDCPGFIVVDPYNLHDNRQLIPLHNIVRIVGVDLLNAEDFKREDE